MRCLVVDHFVTLRRIIRSTLRSLGCHDVTEAADGREALVLCTPDIDVLITGWHLPGMNGIELVKQLRGNPETARIRVLLVTSRNAREHVMEAMEVGVDGYVLKPLDREVLRLKLEELLSRTPSEGTEDQPEARAA